MKTFVLSLLALFASFTGLSANAQSIKWHPGHYVRLTAGDTQTAHFKAIDEIGSETAVKGVQVRLFWYDLEKSKGQYNYALIDSYLKKLKSVPVKKRLVIQVMDRRFSTNVKTGIVPNYMMTDPLYKGGVTATKNGFTARLWEQATMDRLIALYRAIGGHYDAEPYFEAIGNVETTLSLGTNRPAGYSTPALTAQYKRFVKGVRSALPHTNLFFYSNWLGSDALMGELIQSMVVPAVAAGGPNTVPGQLTQGQKVWTGVFGADFRGNLAIANGVESGELGGNHGNFTPKQLHDWAYNTLKVNYMLWSRNTFTGTAAQQWKTGILPYLRTNPKVWTACPTSYGLCNKN
jgi:hypothetical protein